jgi:hypothetical protein
MRIGILTIATGKYERFVKDLVESCESNFLTECEKSYYVFTDSDVSNVSPKIKVRDQKKLGWPYDTMMRFHMFNSISEELYKDTDYLFFLNANMKPISKIGKEVIPEGEFNYVGMIHPSFYNAPEYSLPYERRDESTSKIDVGSGSKYFQGCFNGGKTEHFLKMSEDLSKMLDEDLKNGTYPIWHDESLLNKYYNGRTDILQLDPSYGYPEKSPNQVDYYSYIPQRFGVKMVQKNKALLGGHEFLRS